MAYRPQLKKLDYYESGTGGGAENITEYTNADKPSPTAGDVWVKHTTASGGGEPVGLLLALTTAGSGSEVYELSFYTLSNTIKRVELT